MFAGSPPLWRGRTLADFQMTGTWFMAKEKLIKYVTGSAIKSAAIFRKYDSNLSEPDDLFGSTSFKTFLTSGTVSVLKWNGWADNDWSIGHTVGELEIGLCSVS